MNDTEKPSQLDKVADQPSRSLSISLKTSYSFSHVYTVEKKSPTKISKDHYADHSHAAYRVEMARFSGDVRAIGDRGRAGSVLFEIVTGSSWVKIGRKSTKCTSESQINGHDCKRFCIAFATTIVLGAPILPHTRTTSSYGVFRILNHFINIAHFPAVFRTGLFRQYRPPPSYFFD